MRRLEALLWLAREMVGERLEGEEGEVLRIKGTQPQPVLKRFNGVLRSPGHEQNHAEEIVTQREARTKREGALCGPMRWLKVTRKAVRHRHRVMRIRVLIVDLNCPR